MTHFYMTNPSEVEPRFCKVTDRLLTPGEVVEITEKVASTLLCANVSEFFVGYDQPDWDYYHAPRSL